MKKALFLICALFGVASATLSTNSYAAFHYVQSFSCFAGSSSTCLNNSSYQPDPALYNSLQASCSAYSPNGGPHGCDGPTKNQAGYFIWWGYACQLNYYMNGSYPDGFCSTEPPPPPPDPCDPKQGQTLQQPFFLGDSATRGGSGVQSPYLPPSSMCIDMCRASHTSTSGCYSRAYLPTSDKFGSHAVFCEATYTFTGSSCTPSDDPSNPPPPDAPTDPNDPDTPLPSAPPPTSPPGDDPGAPDGDDGPPTGAPSCSPGTYAVQSGTTWICNSFDNPHPKPDEEGCPAGSQAGTVNGAITCMKGGSTKPSAGSPGSGTSGVSGADGSGPAKAGSVGSTADTGGAVGGGGSSASKGAGSTVVSVDCGTEPVCEGDPLLCGIQKQQWQSSCDIQKAVATPLSDEELEKWNAIGSTDSELHDSQAAAVGRASSMLTELSRRLGFSTSGCPSDMSIHVMGRSIAIALSDACPLLRVLKMLLFMSAYVFSLRVIWSVIV